ncbi:MAG: SMC-Scp complex subunit ScpB, partial [Natronospirillum sp.]
NGFPDTDNARQQVIEAALYASGGALSMDQLSSLFTDEEGVTVADVKRSIVDLQAHNDRRGVELVKVAGGYRYQSKRGLHPWVSRLWDEKPKRYSRALMETLALIAYRQPITRGEIEDVRGVSVASNIVRTLLEREWVRVVGHRDVPGRPALLATTQSFLDYFGLQSLGDLPGLSDIKSLAELEPELDLETGLEHEESSSFADMLRRLKDDESEPNDKRLDQELSEQWHTLDELNDQFETGLRSGPVEGSPAPDTDLSGNPKMGSTTEPDNKTVTDRDGVALTESEQLAFIQQKLVEQARLLEQDESDDEEKDEPSA